MATLLVNGPDGFKEEREVVDGGELTVGRADNNDLILTAGGVSRRHARVYLQDGQVVIEDSGSANGTFLAGNRIKGPQALTAGAQVVIGDYQLTLKPAAARRATPGPSKAIRPVTPGAKAPAGKAPPPKLGGSGAPPTRTLARSGRPMTDAALLDAKARGRVADRPRPRPQVAEKAVEGPQLRGMTGPWAGKTFPIQELMSVGRVPGVSLQLDDDSVSRKHAELEPTEEGVVLRDLQSANGTAVNGVPVTEEVLLTPGDIIQFGVVELQYQDREDRIPQGAVPVAGSGRKKLLIVGTATVGLLFAAGFILKATGPARPTGPAPVVDVKAQISEHLSVCRSYVSTELGNEPNWDKAEVACNKALDLEPINAEANELIRRIKFEQENFHNYDAAERAMKLDREEEALSLYARIGEGSTYYLKVKARIADAVDQTLRKSKEQCDRYVRNGELRPALERCETYMKFQCQQMSREDLHPPPGHKLRIDDGGRLRANEWRPPDAMYRKFLRVRARVDPGAPAWECPVMTIIRPRQAGVQPWEEVEKALRGRYSEKMMWNALFLYWQGKDNEANRQFLRIVEDVSKADLHRESETLRRDASAVASFFKAGQTSLQQDDVEAAAKSFEEAWNLDAKLMGDLAERLPSFWRTNIGADLAEKSYEKGKYFADRQDPLRACRIWKTAFRFYKGNTSINKAIGFCSTQATAALANAGSCDDLRTAITYAVTGDGVEEKAIQRKAELGCP